MDGMSQSNKGARISHMLVMRQTYSYLVVLFPEVKQFAVFCYFPVEPSGFIGKKPLQRVSWICLVSIMQV